MRLYIPAFVCCMASWLGSTYALVFIPGPGAKVGGLLVAAASFGAGIGCVVAASTDLDAKRTHELRLAEHNQKLLETPLA